MVRARVIMRASTLDENGGGRTMAVPESLGGISPTLRDLSFFKVVLGLVARQLSPKLAVFGPTRRLALSLEGYDAITPQPASHSTQLTKYRSGVWGGPS